MRIWIIHLIQGVAQFMVHIQSYAKNIITRKESSMIHSASPQSRPAVIIAWYWRFGTDGRTLCVKIVITTGRDCGRPRGSIKFYLVMFNIDKNDWNSVLPHNDFGRFRFSWPRFTRDDDAGVLSRPFHGPVRGFRDSKNVRRSFINLATFVVIDLGLVVDVQLSIKTVNNKKGVINDPLGQTPIVTPVANIVFCCFVFLDLKSTYVQTDGHVRKQWSLPAVTLGCLGWPSGSITIWINGRKVAFFNHISTSKLSFCVVNVIFSHNTNKW